MKQLIFIAITIFLHFSGSVDETLFKKCSQSSFCRRCRNVSGPTPYEVMADTLFTGNRDLSVDIKNKENGVILQLTLEVLQDNTFHFTIDEKSPLKLRYHVPDVILTESIKHEAFTVSSSASEITATPSISNKVKAVIKISPFKLEFYHDGILSLTVNSKNLMRFEHLRVKPSVLDPNEDPDSWEESFRGVVDTKPNGPEAVGLDFTFPESEVLFGIPEHGDSFSLKTTVGSEPYRLFNLDVFEHLQDSRMAIYGSVPVIYGHGARKTAGVFWLNSADTFIDIHDSKTSHFISEAGIMDCYVLLGPTPAETFKQYTKLTGVAGLPQMFALGYHQSRWNYESQSDVLEVVENFDKKDIPLDTMWLDIEYTDQKKYFTWDHSTFPRPLEMMEKLKETGRHLTFIIDPHVKKDLEYDFYVKNKERGYFVKNKDGNDFEGNCWPGLSSYVDHFNPEARRFYANQYLLENFPENSVESGIWNDMNEPSVFDVPEITMFRDNIHHGGWEHRVLHNTYGFMNTMGTFDGVKRRGDGKYRPFILTRAFFGGTQRYAAIWTGDNTANWIFLQASIKMCLSVSVAGISFCGSDIGGFFGDPETELLLRWYQAAAYQPFFRAHAHEATKRREPFLLPDESMVIARDAIRARYSLLPLWYTMFYEHERTGSPVMQPMLAVYPSDKNCFKLDDQYMLSDKLLVRPVMEKGVKTVNVRFPSTDGSQNGDLWYDFDDYRKIDKVGVEAISVDEHKIPVFQKGGTIIPKKTKLRKSSTWMVDDPISIFIAVDRENAASGTLYIDDETSYDYRDGKYLYLQFDFKKDKLTSKFVDKNSNYSTKSTLNRVSVAGLENLPEFVTVELADGTKMRYDIKDGTKTSFSVGFEGLKLTEEWTITFSGARKNVIGLTLTIFVMIFNFAKLF